MPSYRTSSSKPVNPATNNGNDGNDGMYNNNDNNNQTQQQPSASASSAPLSTSKKKQHQHLLMVQLRNAIYETYSAPPDGATEEMVLERRAQLEQLLKNLEGQYQQTKNEALEAYNNRWLKSMTDQLKKEKSTDEKIRTNETASKNQQTVVAQMKHSRVHGQNEARDEKIMATAKMLTDQKRSTMRSVLRSVKQQDDRYKMMQERKEEEARMWKQRQMAAEKHCEEMLQRKQERDDDDRNAKELKAQTRRREAEDRLLALQERKAAEAQERSEKARETYRKGNVVKIAVEMRGGKEPKLVNIEIPYEERLKRSQEAQMERDKQVESRKRELQAHWQATIGDRHRKFLERQQENHNAHLEAHDQQCTQLQASIRRQNDEAMERKRQREEENLLRTQMKDEEINMHRQRHSKTVHNFQDDAKRRVFERWNRQLVQVSAELGIALPENLVAAANNNNNNNNNNNSASQSKSVTPQPGGAKFLPGVGGTAKQQQQQQQQQRNNNYGDDGNTFLTQQRGGGTPAKLGNFVGK